jgi:hypothetical protein
MTTTDLARWRRYAPLLVVLLVATILRVGKLGIVQYQYDEMLVTILAKDLVAGRSIPLEGIVSSVGVPNTPMTVYIAAIPYLVTSDPVMATLFVMLYNVIGVGLLWGLVRRYIGPIPAFFAGLVYAVNPWAVLFSRKIWAQSLLSTLVILAFWLGMLGFVERKRWAQALCLPVLVVIAQIHYSGVMLAPVYGWFLWQGRHHLARRALVISVMLSVILMMPFMIGLSRFTAEDWQRYEDIFQGGAVKRHLTTEPLTNMHSLITGLKMETWMAPEQAAEARDAINAPRLLWELLAAAVLVGAVILARQPDHRRMAEALALWIALPALLFASGWTRVIFHYFLFEIPALAILIGVCIAWLWAQRARWIQGTTAVVLTLILMTQIRGWYGLLDYVDTHSTPGGFGTPIHYLMKPRDVLARFDDVLIVNDGPWIWRSILLNEISSVREVALSGSDITVIPDGPFAVISPTPDHIYQSADHRVFPLRPGEGDYYVDIFKDGFAWEGEAGVTAIDPVLFDNGVRLIGYALDRNSVLLAWQLPDAQTGYYQYFIHFEDATGKRVAQVDTLFWPCESWRRNDRIYIRYDLDWPEGTTLLRVGLYRLRGKNYINSNVLNADGAPVQQWADIPVLSEP